MSLNRLPTRRLNCKNSNDSGFVTNEHEKLVKIRVDLGLTTFAYFSNGEKIERQRWMQQDAKDIARLNLWGLICPHFRLMYEITHPEACWKSMLTERMSAKLPKVELAKVGNG